MTEAVITLQGIHKNYGSQQVLTGLDLKIEKGEIYGLIGRNGSGKTTLFKVILGMTDYTGNLNIGEAGTPLSKGRSKIGFFIGSSYFTYMTGKQNLEYYRILKGVKDKNCVDELLKIVGLENAKGPVKGYSLGMRQRLGIANALLGDPEILILDEPINGLDPQGVADIRNLLRRLNREKGMTIIVSSHILSELQNTAHQFAIVNDGVIAAVISEEELTQRRDAIRIDVDDAQKAREVLQNAGIKILNESAESLSLEDYYFHLIGGAQ